MNDYEKNDVGNVRCCANCRRYEDRTHFCRANPPVPMVFVDQNGDQKVSSKFPVITMPMTDYCENHYKSRD